jgi:23S rRNA pseudouridine955/2504/2580 synthase
VKRIIGGRPPPASAEVQFLTVGEESEGQRLDNFLIRLLKGVPKTHVYRIIRSGEVRLNKGRAAADSRVALGDIVRVPPVRVSEAPAEKAERPAPAREFPVLFEDESVLAIDKPAGVAVHGGSGVSFGVIEQLRQARPTARFLELVHRLDRETSGILLVAKKRSALTKLQDQFRERDAGFTLLEVTIKTGRTHQIRVHLASAGHPIAGDDKYGDFELNKALARQGLKRMFLHAWRLQFDHPATGERIALQAPLPAELQRFTDHVRANPTPVRPDRL